MQQGMRAWRAWCFASFCLLAGCGERLAPLPEQRPWIAAEDPPDERYLVRFAVKGSDRAIVRDIYAGDGPRWSGKRPAVRVELPDSPGPLAAVAEIYFSGATLKHTGPVEATLELNGRPVGKLTAAKEGLYTFRQTVEASGVTELGLNFSKVWHGPTDGKELGALIQAIGFVRR